MPTIKYALQPIGWFVIVRLPNKGVVAQFGPFSEGERDAFMDGAEAFCSPYSATFDRTE